MLSNFEISSIFQSYNTPLEWIGMKDQMPKEIKDGNYIINLASASSGSIGTHWLSLRIDKENAFYCDSFGAPPPTEIVQFVKKREHSHLGYNDYIIQNIKSENCGYYASAILIYLEKHKNIPLYNSANAYIKQYKDNTTKNDQILKTVYAGFSSTKPKLIARLDKEKIKY